MPEHARLQAMAPPPSAEIILLPKTLRMDWVDVIALDRRLTPTEFRIACVIGTHFGNKSGLTYVSQKTIAKVTSLSASTVYHATKKLESVGYLIVRRREVGVRQDGRRVYGGRGTANEYLPGIDSRQISATARGQRLISRARELWDARDARKHSADDDPSRSEGTPPSATLDISREAPATFPPTEHPSRVQAESAYDGPLGAAGNLLRRKIGADKFVSWFSKCTIHSDAGTEIVLIAPTKFIQSYVLAQFEVDMLKAWQAVRPSIVRVSVVVRTN